MECLGGELITQNHQRYSRTKSVCAPHSLTSWCWASRCPTRLVARNKICARYSHASGRRTSWCVLRGWWRVASKNYPS